MQVWGQPESERHLKRPPWAARCPPLAPGPALNTSNMCLVNEGALASLSSGGTSPLGVMNSLSHLLSEKGYSAFKNLAPPLNGKFYGFFNN